MTLTSDARDLPDNKRAANAYVVGGGIAALATAALLIRDGGLRGDQIQIFEDLDRPGGSLDGAGSAEDGFLIRGGRMFEDHYHCMFDLLDSIPTLTDPDISVAGEMREFSRRVVTSSHCRIVRDGKRIDGPAFELSLRDKLDLGRLAIRSERSLHDSMIQDYFRPDFFRSNFWVMWATMFSFQPWHSLAEFRRYMFRFVHLLPGFNRLEGIGRTPLNQFDSIVLPLLTWLKNQGTQFHMNTRVVRVDFRHHDGQATAVGLCYQNSDGQHRIELRDNDLAFVSLGSMTDHSTIGSMTTAPHTTPTNSSPSWTLWKQIAAESPRFGRPEIFCSDISRTRWESFTVTLRDKTFFDFMQNFTGNSAGTGGLVTFRDSSWLMSVVLAWQPHFTNQPEDVRVFWGYGLFPDRMGDFIRKPMDQCSGAEILEELFFHLRQQELGRSVVAAARCIPCMMPYITSQFMPRQPGDRPEVVPEGAVNFAFIGQYCELPEDVVFTVEYSVRTAMTAVCQLSGLKQKPRPVYKGHHHPAVLWRAVKTILR